MSAAPLSTDRVPAEMATAPTTLADVVAVAHAAAGAVDRDGRFPIEAVTAMRATGMLGAHVPVALGGAGLDVAGLTRVCFQLGGACASSAMVYAMHQIQVACLVGHAPDQVVHLARVAQDNLLLASVTSEVGARGDIRTSGCAIEREADEHVAVGFGRITKQATNVSYGAHADGLIVTARRTPNAAPADQVAVLMFADQYTLERTGRWDAMGMRGTCSDAFVLRASVPDNQIMAVPFADMAAGAMTPVAHLLWAGVWLGIATDALGRARACTRRQRGPDGGIPPAAGAVAAALMRYRQGEAQLRTMLDDYGAGRPIGPLDWNGLKVGVSEVALDVVTQAMRICGIAGFRNDGPYSVARHLRDIMSGVLMIGNERVVANSGNLALMQPPRLGAF